MAEPKRDSAAPKKERTLSAPVKIYLILYNLALVAGWSAVLYQLLIHASAHVDYAKWEVPGAYDAVKILLQISQTAAILEIFHVLFKFVPSSLAVTFIQVMSRIIILWGIADRYPSVTSHWSFTTMVISWGITEIVRYLNYAAGLVNAKPGVLLWLRYTLFFILYPTGAGSEFILAYTARNLVLEEGIYYYYALLVVLALYIPLFPVQYFHMISQRKKYLSPRAKRD